MLDKMAPIVLVDIQQSQRTKPSEETNVDAWEKHTDLSGCPLSIGKSQSYGEFRTNDTHKLMKVRLGEWSAVQRISMMSVDSCSECLTDISYGQE